MLSAEEGTREVSMIAKLGRNDRGPIVGRSFATCARVCWYSTLADVSVCLDMSTRHCVRRNNVMLNDVDSLDACNTQHTTSPISTMLTLLPFYRVKDRDINPPSRAMRYPPLDSTNLRTNTKEN